MTIAVGMFQQAVNTIIGTQEFRDPNMTETPNAYILVMGRATANGTPVPHANVTWGCSDGTTSFTIGQASEDAQVNSDTLHSSNNTVMYHRAYGNAVNGIAVHDSFLADVGAGAGIQIDWTTAPDDAFLMAAFMFKLDNVKVGTYANNATVDGETIVTLGWQPTGLLVGTNNTDLVSSGNHSTMSMGFCDGNLNQLGLAHIGRDNRAASEQYAQEYSNRVGGYIDFFIVNDWEIEITSITATTFVSTVRTNGSGATIGYMAFDTGNREFVVSPISSPTATGDDVQTWPGHTPQFIMQVLSALTVRDTDKTDGTAGAHAISAFTANDEVCYSFADEDAETPTDTQSLVDNQAINMPDDAGIAFWEASRKSIDAATGYTLDTPTYAPGTAVLGFGFSIEAEPSAVRQPRHGFVNYQMPGVM